MKTSEPLRITSAPSGFRNITTSGTDGRCYLHNQLPVAICTREDGSLPEMYFVEWDDQESEAKRTQPANFFFLRSLSSAEPPTR